MKLPQQKIAQAVSILLLAYIAFQLSELTWQFAAPSDNGEQVIVSQARQSATKEKIGTDVSNIIALNLFGEYQAQPVIVQPKEEVKDAPETKLNLTLSGVVASSDEDIATAVIEHNGKQNTFGIGDKIEGTRAILQHVYFDRVIIKHSGRSETLMLDGIKYGTKPVSAAQPVNNFQQKQKIKQAKKLVDNRENRSLSNKVNNLKNVINNEPAKITDYLRYSQSRRNGQLVGYQLMPGKDPEFFRASGLKSGDIAIQINGYDLTSPSDAFQALKALKTESEVSLWVDRNGEVTEILFSIEN